MKEQILMKRFLLLAILTLSFIFCNSQSFVKHIIQPGETLHSIAKKYGMSEGDIQNANPSIHNFITGYTLVIPTSKDTANDAKIQIKETTSEEIPTLPSRSSISSSEKRFVRERNGKCGLCDEDGNVIIPFEYDYIGSIEIVRGKAQVYKVQQNDKQGIIDRDGNVIISTSRGYNLIHAYFSFEKKYDLLFGSDIGSKGSPTGYFKVVSYSPKDKKHKKPVYGLCDINGYEVIEPFYYDIEAEYNGKETDFSLKITKKSDSYSARLCLNEFGESMRKPTRYFDEYKYYNSANYIHDAIRDLYNEYKALYDVPWKSKYIYVKYDKDGDIFYVRDKNYAGVCDRSGYEIVPLSSEYKSVSYEDKFFVVRKDSQLNNGSSDNYGACDMAGIEFIPPMFYDIKYNKQDNSITYATKDGQKNTIVDPFDSNGCYQGSISAEEIAINETIRRRQVEEEKLLAQQEKRLRRQEIMGALLQVAVVAGQSIVQSKLQKETAPDPNVKLGEMSEKELANWTNSKLTKIAQLSMAQGLLQEQNEYLNFANNCKKPDGSMYSIDEWRTMKGAAIMQLKEEGIDIIGDMNESMRQERKERDEQRRADAKRRNEQIIARTYGTQLQNATSAKATAPINAQNTEKPRQNVVAKPKTNTTATTQGDSKQQFKSDPVSSDDYKYIKKVTLYARHGDQAKVSIRDVDLCIKGGFKYVKIGNKYYPRMSPNWMRYSNAITYGSEQLYYDE